MSQVAPLTLLSAIVVLDASLDGWSLLEPGPLGPRVFRHDVLFVRPFSSPPVVHVGIVGLDVSKDHNLRVRVRPADISAGGFTLEAETWLNTQIWSVEVSWLAVGS
jgi:hypothetical protein